VSLCSVQKVYANPAQIWDISKKRIKHLLTGHNQEIYSLDFSRDGQFLVSGSGDKSARIWDINSGHCVFDLKIEDVVLGEAGPIDAGITSVAREYARVHADCG
jgi:glucose repression regulatory protein TUP1